MNDARRTAHSHPLSSAPPSPTLPPGQRQDTCTGFSELVHLEGHDPHPRSQEHQTGEPPVPRGVPLTACVAWSRRRLRGLRVETETNEGLGAHVHVDYPVELKPAPDTPRPLPLLGGRKLRGSRVAFIRGRGGRAGLGRCRALNQIHMTTCI